MKTKALFILALSIGLIQSCSESNNCKRGGGGIKTEFFSLETFDKVDLQVEGNLIIKQGVNQSVIVKGHQNVVDAIKQNVNNGLWEIEFGNKCFKKYDLDIVVTVSNLKMAGISGLGQIDIEDFSNQGDLSLNISGKGTINLNQFDGPQIITSSISGDGIIKATKPISIKKGVLHISGKGDYNAYPIIADDYKVNISGLGVCYLHANSNLEVNISGNGEIHYKGKPTITQKISGLGNLINEN